MSDPQAPEAPAYVLPPVGGNPGNSENVTTPGSFANPACIKPGSAGATTFSSPNSTGMPSLPTKTAWDFMPEGWSTKVYQPGEPVIHATYKDHAEEAGYF